MGFKLKYFSFIGIAILIWLLLKIDFTQLFTLLGDVNLWLLILAALFFMLSLMVNFLRWHYIVNNLGIHIPVKEAIKISFKSLFAENTPGRVGEPLLKASYLKESAKSHLSISLFSTVFHKFIDLWSAVIQAIVVVTILFLLFKIKLLVLIPSILFFSLIIATIFVLIYNRKLSANIIRPIYDLFVPKKHKEKVRKNTLEFYENFKKINKEVLWVSFFYDLVEVIIAGISLYFIVLSLNQDVLFIHPILLIPLLTIGVGLPISVAGLGIRETILVFYFGFLEISPEVAIATGMIFLIIKLLSAIPGLIIGILER
jgi:hypothetical protein